MSDDDHQHIPLGVKYETKPIWADIQRVFGVGATGAAIVVAAFEGFFAGRGVSYSRNRNFYGPHRHKLITYRSVIEAVDDLDAGGWIHHHKQPPGIRGLQSWFEATTELVDAMQDILSKRPRLELARLQSTTILRDEDGKPLTYRRTRDIDRQDKKTAGFNEAITAASIWYPEADNVVHLSGLAAPMARIYNGTFARGGRFYPMGTSWQNIKAEARRKLTIDGEPVIELDFDGMHVAMLYAESGLPLPDDCHQIDGWPRKLVKVATFTMINAKTEKSARMAIAHNEAIRSLAEPGTQEAIRITHKLMKAIKAKHRPIQQHLHSHAGARLMRKDSDIAEAVMADLITRKGILALPVHDSFLVPESKRDELERAMIEASYRVMGTYLSVSKAGAK